MILADQVTLFHPGGGSRLCPLHFYPHPRILNPSFSPIPDARMPPREAGRPERNRLVFFESFFHSLNLLIQLTFAVTIVGNNFQSPLEMTIYSNFPKQKIFHIMVIYFQLVLCEMTKNTDQNLKCMFRTQNKSQAYGLPWFVMYRKSPS